MEDQPPFTIVVGSDMCTEVRLIYVGLLCFARQTRGFDVDHLKAVEQALFVICPLEYRIACFPN